MIFEETSLQRSKKNSEVWAPNFKTLIVASLNAAQTPSFVFSRTLRSCPVPLNAFPLGYLVLNFSKRNWRRMVPMHHNLNRDQGGSSLKKISILINDQRQSSRSFLSSYMMLSISSFHFLYCSSWLRSATSLAGFAGISRHRIEWLINDDSFPPDLILNIAASNQASKSSIDASRLQTLQNIIFERYFDVLHPDRLEIDIK